MSFKLSFRWSFTILVAMGVGLCSILVVLTLLQPPRLRHRTINTALAVSRPNERLTLSINQPVATIRTGQVVVSPKTDFSVTSSGETVVIQFSGRLRYNTTYTVQVRGVRSAYQHTKQANLVISFTTADPTYFYLRRNYQANIRSPSLDKQPDEIIRTTLSGKTKDVVFSAPEIQDYIIAGKYAAVITIDKDTKTNQLYTIDLAHPEHQKRVSPSMPGTISHLQVAPGTDIIGFTFSSSQVSAASDYENVLLNIDLGKQTDVYPITGLNGRLLRTLDWRFAPDGTTILAQTYDTSLLLIDTTNKHQPVPLGQYAYIENFSYNGAKLVVDKGNGPGVLDILADTFSVLPDTTVNGATTHADRAVALSNSEGYVLRLQAYDGDNYEYYLVLSDKHGSKTVYTTSGNTTSLGSFGLSPNDQLLAAEVNSTVDTKNDDYLDNGRSTDVHTLMIDTQTAKTVQDIDGFDVQWQSEVVD